MPKDDTQQPATNSNNQQPSVVMPPVLTEDVVAPDLPEVKTDIKPMVNEKPKEDVGSAAPSNDVVMPIQEISSTPRKKFAGGKVIATILSLFLLVGGIGAGTYLVQQNQDIREKAETFEECRQESGTQVCNCRVYGNCTRPDAHTDPQTPWVTAPPSNNNDNCDRQCGGPGLAFNFCMSSTSSRTCNQEAEARGYNVPLGCSDGSNGQPDVRIPCSTCTTGYRCPVAGEPGYANSGTIYLCTNAQYEAAGGVCDSRTPGVRILNSAPSCFCGILQVDASDGSHRSESSSCGCGGNNTPPPTVPPTPSPTPLITASCQNVKAYSETWTLLTQNQLAALRPTDKVNFCVAGVATGGSFNKARFTINGALQAETTTVRPTSTDFCQLYTIPSGVNTFSVSAQINHVTLGWK